MTNAEIWTLYARYVEAWKPIEAAQRAAIVAETLSATLQYFTPEFQGGPEAALADMQSFQTKFPGAYFGIEDISAHHGHALFTWVFFQPDGTVAAKGHDHIQVADGRIASLTTFPPSTPKP